MNKSRIVVALAILFPLQVFAAQQPLQTRANTISPSVDTNFSRQHLMNTEIYTTKADKDKVVRIWSDHPDGTTIVAGTPVWYSGKLYNTTQNFLKTAGATPDTFTEYFEQASGGVTRYTDLTDKPTLGTAAEQNVGTGVGNVPQIGSDGKIPSGVYNAGLSSQPTDTGQSLISSGAAVYGWLPNVPLTTNPSGLIVNGIINLTGFQPLDPALTAASALDGSGPNKMNGTDGDGVVGIMNIPGKPTIQATPPTTSNAEGFYGDIATGKFYYRADGGTFDITAGTYTPDPTLKTLTITPPSNGTIICDDPALSQSISCPGVCTASATTGAVIAGITAQADSGYAFGAFTGDITGASYNTGTVTLSADKSGSATFTSTAEWAIDDPFTVDSASTYTRVSGTTATLAVNTVLGKAYNSYAYSTGWFAHPTNLGSANQVVQAVLQDRAGTSSGGTGILMRSNGSTSGYGCHIDAQYSRFSCAAIGGEGADFLKSFTAGAWADGTAHNVQITAQADHYYKFEVDFNDDGDFLDTNEQVGLSSIIHELPNGTYAGIGSRTAPTDAYIDNFRAKAL